VGYFYLDTTKYQDGVHTIAWSVEDDAGNTDGIGSRYFSTQNSAYRNKASVAEDISNIPIDTTSPALIQRGYDRQVTPIKSYPGPDGVITVEIRELERLAIPVGEPLQTLPAGRLPIGSTYDATTGLFSWQPGPGFVGNYRLNFIVRGAGRKMIRKQFLISIIPKFSQDSESKSVNE
jgi:hypothetical protein